MILKSYNPETDGLEKTYLSSAIAAGTTSLPVKNNNKFATSDRIMLGEMGQEKTEIVTVSSVSGNTTIVSGATVYPHGADTPIYLLNYDQVRFYRSTDGGVNYTLLATVDMDVDNADLMTIYDDTTSTTAYFYKIALYHSVSTAASDYSDPLIGTGYALNTAGRIITDLLDEFGIDAEQNITKNEMLSYMNEMHDDIHSTFQKPPSILHTRSAYTRTADRNYLAIPSTMWKFDRMDYNYTDSTTSPTTDNTYALRVVSVEEFRDLYQDNTIDSTTVDDNCQVIAIDDAVGLFRYYPPSETTTASVFYLYYWKYFTEIDSFGDVIETDGSKIYKDFIRARYYRKIAKREPSYLDIADRYQGDYERDKLQLQRANRRDMGSPRSFGFRGGKDFKGFRGY